MKFTYFRFLFFLLFLIFGFKSFAVNNYLKPFYLTHKCVITKAEKLNFLVNCKIVRENNLGYIDFYLIKKNLNKVDSDDFSKVDVFGIGPLPESPKIISNYHFYSKSVDIKVQELSSEGIYIFDLKNDNILSPFSEKNQKYRIVINTKSKEFELQLLNVKNEVSQVIKTIY